MLQSQPMLRAARVAQCHERRSIDQNHRRTVRSLRRIAPRAAPIVDVVVAGRQVRRIGILLEYSLDDRPDIKRGLGSAQRRKPFVNRLTHHIRERHATCAKSLRLTKSVGVEPYVD